ncbi:Glu/Leu/Phe/Val dehydrogenase dimerization domain-containing protein [Streptomyces sp. NPDC056069]|uniref:Glu/Leu/Phe/Val dehydrogenase dimerization domain-containing protein n=1 Tax=Streptomyces sp. NPDC056069 TaxID=3345702 RepID=UPI0035DDB185
MTAHHDVRAPIETIEWRDDRTGAVGWIVIDALVNGVSGGGLFMHPGATQAEVTDLAATMTFKNTLNRPRFGGGKGGIRFDARRPEAEGVLRRFMVANREVIAERWSTGADLYTSNEAIERIARQDLGLPSAFAAMAAMISRTCGIPSQAHLITPRMASPLNEYFTLEECATGHSLASAIRQVDPHHPRVALQGFGKVGSSAAFMLQDLDIAEVVGICEHDGFLVHPDGLDTVSLVRQLRTTGETSSLGQLAREGKTGGVWYPRVPGQGDEALLIDFLRITQPTVFSPCATRYAITPDVLKTFMQAGGRHIVCGANNAFSEPDLAAAAEEAGITALPEWVSNSGNAMLFTEILATPDWDDDSADTIFHTIQQRISDYIHAARTNSPSLRAGCHLHARQIMATTQP